MSPPKRKHCWECLRRRLVCDLTKPLCNRCQTAGIPCPGYGEKKPLRWLDPGQVTAGRPKNPKSRSKVSRDGGRLRTSQESPLTILCDLDSLDVGYLKAVKAIYYCFANTLQIIPQLRIFELPANSYQNAPLYIHNLLMLWALVHRIHQLPDDANPRSLTTAWSSYYHHRGEVIRSLAAEVSQTNLARRTHAIIALGQFLVIEIQLGNLSWRIHYAALAEIVRCSGGLEGCIRSLYVGPITHHVLNVNIFGNATSPRHDQVTAITWETMVRVVSKYYEPRNTPNLICPRELVLSTVHINSIRSSAVCHFPESKLVPPTPNELLEQIDAFSPADWSHSIGTGAEELQCLGRIYQSAVALYCILSLQSAQYLSETPKLEAQKEMHQLRLMSLLRTAISSPRLERAILWPFAVAGVGAARSGAADRDFISEKLGRLKFILGQATPLILRDALQRFWCSGSDSWDVCFDRPYCFVGA